MQVSIDEAHGEGSSQTRAPEAVAVRRNTLPARQLIPSWLPSTPTSFGCRKASCHPRPCPPFTPLARRCSNCRGASREWPAAPEARSRRDRHPSINISIISSTCSCSTRRRASAAFATGMPCIANQPCVAASFSTSLFCHWIFYHLYTVQIT